MARKRASQLNREIGEALRRSRGKRLMQAAKQANNDLYDLVHNKFFPAVPLDQIFGIVEQAGFHFDPEEKLCILTGREGRATWQLYGEPGREVEHTLVVQWHKMDVTGLYEIVAYVS